ncbi:MAG: Rv3654c family TadE-like protein [Pedococcus sp.]
MSASRAIRRRAERGSGTVLALAATGVLLMLLVAGLALASAVAAAHRARAGADLAALAAASAVQAGATDVQACQRAARVFAANAVEPSGCTVASDGSVRVEATATVGLVLPGTPPRARATARAGPAPSL